MAAVLQVHDGTGPQADSYHHAAGYPGCSSRTGEPCWPSLVSGHCLLHASTLMEALLPEVTKRDLLMHTWMCTDLQCGSRAVVKIIVRKFFAGPWSCSHMEFKIAHPHGHFLTGPPKRHIPCSTQRATAHIPMVCVHAAGAAAAAAASRSSQGCTAECQPAPSKAEGEGCSAGSPPPPRATGRYAAS